MRYGDLTYEEIRERADQGWLALVPTGCTEQQGPHLPVDFDTWFVERVSLAASERAAHSYGVRCLVLPATPFGPTPEHRNYGTGYVDIPVGLHESLTYAILSSLAKQGFQRIVVWRGCGGHDLRTTIERFNKVYSNKAKAYLPAHPYHDIWCRLGDPSVSGGHADSFATSIALYLRPETVRTEKIADPRHAEVDWSDPGLDFSRYSSTGVIGDPTHASAALGAKLWGAIVDEIAAVLKAIAEGSDNPEHLGSNKLHFLQRTSYRTGADE